MTATSLFSVSYLSVYYFLQMEHQLAIVVLLGLCPLVLSAPYFHLPWVPHPIPYAPFPTYNVPRTSYKPRPKVDTSRSATPMYLTNGQWLRAAGVSNRGAVGGYRSPIIPSFYAKRADSVDNRIPSPPKRVHACPFFHRLGRPVGDCYSGRHLFKPASQQRQQQQRFHISRWPILHMLGGALGKRGDMSQQTNGFFQYL